MAWFSRVKSGADESTDGEKRIRTEGLWLKCEGCGQIIWKKTLDENFQTCPQCGYHFRVDARARLALLFDDGVYQELDAGLTSTDPLQFSDSKTYAARLAEMQEATSLSDALISGWGTLAGHHLNVCGWKPRSQQLVRDISGRGARTMGMGRVDSDQVLEQIACQNSCRFRGYRTRYRARHRRRC